MSLKLKKIDCGKSFYQNKLIATTSKFNETNMFVDGYDIMFFILDQPIDEFTDEIQPACLPFNQSAIDYPPPNSTSLIAGWGLTDVNTLADDLQNALNKVSDCINYIPKLNRTERIVCTVSYIEFVDSRVCACSISL